MTGDEKWVYFDNPKRKNHGWMIGQPSTPKPKRNIHGHKAVLSIRWELGSGRDNVLRATETAETVDRYQQQLYRLNDELMRKRPSIASNRRKVILLHDNARPHVPRTKKKHCWSSNEKFSRTQLIFQTWLHRIIIFSDHCNMRLSIHTSPIIQNLKYGSFKKQVIVVDELLPEKMEKIRKNHNGQCFD